MEWTTEKPRNPGWYWRYVPNYQDVILEVIRGREKNRKRLYVVGPGYSDELDSFRGGEWAGPIPEPTECEEG